MLRTRAVSLIAAAVTAGVLIAPAAAASATTTAQPTCYARGATRCLVVTQSTPPGLKYQYTPPGLKYRAQAQPGNEWNPHGG